MRGKKLMSLINELQEVKIPVWTHRWHIATPYRWWIMFSTVLGYIMLRVVLSVVYYILITPVGLFMWALRHDAMRRRPATTYWINTNE